MTDCRGLPMEAEIQNALAEKTKLRRHGGIKLPEELGTYPARPEIDALVEKGFRLEEMMIITGDSCQSIRNYIIYSGLCLSWRERSENRPEQHPVEKLAGRTERKRILSLLKSRLLQRAGHPDISDEDWPLKKAVEYFALKEKSSYELGFCEAIFRRYQEAFLKGENRGLDYLCEGKLSKSSVERLLGSVGLEPMFEKFERPEPLSPEMTTLALRAYHTELGFNDTGYFLEVSGNAVMRKQLREYRLVRRKKPLMSTAHSGIITYRLASEIYEARDARFTREETAELVGKSELLVDCIMIERERFEPRIIEQLRMLFGDDSIDRPYVALNTPEKRHEATST